MRIQRIICGMVFGAVMLLGLASCGANPAPDDTLALKETPVVVELGSVSVAELKSITDADPDVWVLDVRTPDEYREVHAIPVKELIVHTEIDQAADRLPAAKDRPIYVICRSGRRSTIAGEKLIELGYTKVFNVAGGTSDWVKEGFPTESGEGVLATPQQR